MKRLVEKIAGAVAGEHAAGAIGAVRGGSEAENQEPGARIAKAGNGLAPVFPVAKRETLFARDFFAVAHQARALPALDDLSVELVESVQIGLPGGKTRCRRPSKSVSSSVHADRLFSMS